MGTLLFRCIKDDGGIKNKANKIRKIRVTALTKKIFFI